MGTEEMAKSIPSSSRLKFENFNSPELVRYVRLF